ncbi:DUF4214 domain-containing protein [Ectopseudomonas oleovorans]|uniref:DUF4214 domain-containing protein n=1 Tax=Ectopseudomonas oleovorans TaxID=301 RepID=UPI0014833596|nr:DUF4214 domain-containing protein [Pseudomonas oleovorans]
MAVTVQQEVAALYSAIFNRAPDQEGLNNWVNLIQGGASLTQTADGFVQHPVFTELYAGLTNIQFVQQLYINVLGSEGDAKGIQNWVNLLASGVSKAQVVADFVKGALSVDLDAMLASGELTQAEYDAAVVRQDTLTNKANVGIYFAETFGAASNLNPATDTSTVAGLQADPAYLASQAAIANVTNAAASVTAAQGRIDVAVATNDPAGNLIGANSALTAALVDLQTKQAAVADALEALALADNANELDGAAVLDEDSTPTTLEAFVAGYDAAAAADTKEEAETFVGTKQVALASANTDLSAARNDSTALVDGKLPSDANLAANVAAKLAAVNADATAKALFTDVNNAEAALAADVTAKGDSVALLTALRTAIAEYTKAGGDLNATIDGATNTYDIATLLADVNTALQTDAGTGLTTASDALLTTLEAAGYAGLAPVAPATELTATAKAINDAVDVVEARVELIGDVTAAEAFFDANTLGGNLRDAEGLVDARQLLIDAVEAAQAELTEAQEYLAEVNALYGNLETAQANVEAALDTIAAQGYNIGTISTGNDVFVADLSADSTIGAGFAGGDVLFIGTNYANGGAALTADFTELLAGGSSSALEVFFEKTATDTVVHIETQPFDSNATGAPDMITITLTGVTADLVFENGFVSVA